MCDDPDGLGHTTQTQAGQCMPRYLLGSEPLPWTVLTACVWVQTWQPAFDNEYTVALFPQCCKKGCQVERAQKLRCWVQRVEIIPAATNHSERQPMLLRSAHCNAVVGSDANWLHAGILKPATQDVHTQSSSGAQGRRLACRLQIKASSFSGCTLLLLASGLSRFVQLRFQFSSALLNT